MNDIRVTIDDERAAKIPESNRCEKCEGTGNEFLYMYRQCSECNGTGKKGYVCKYPINTKLRCNGVDGIVVENTKFPNDVCIQWESGMFSSYDIEWLDENTTIPEIG